MLPPEAVVVETRGDAPDSSLWPSEEVWAAGFSPDRRAEFGTVRNCARHALVGLGAPAVALLPRAGRAPQWPPGVVGSLTHCTGYRAAAVAWKHDVQGLGIDVDRDTALPAGALDLICCPAERGLLARLPRAAAPWDRVLFSAKEAIYKCWQPLTGRDHAWDDVAVELRPGTDPQDGRFVGRLRASARPARLPMRVHGSYAVRPGLVAAAVALAAPDHVIHWTPAPPGPLSPGSSSARPGLSPW